MILVEGIWFNEESNSDLLEIAKMYNEEFFNALEEKFRYYESIDYYED